MVTRSIDNYKQHKIDIQNYFLSMFPNKEKYIMDFMDFYSSRYDEHNRSFLYYKVAWLLYDDFRLVNKSGMRWYAVVGVGGTGKTTLSKNVAYFLDPSFQASRVKFSANEIVKQLNIFPITNAMKSLILDEPDHSIHPTSQEGKRVRSITGKARQQSLFMIYNATDMNDIPNYIYKKISGIFFCPSLKRAMYFKDRQNPPVYVVQSIKKDYKDLGYGAFFKYQKSLGCIAFTTCKDTPLSDEEESQYLQEKESDYKKEIESYIKASEINYSSQSKSDRINVIKNLKNDGYKDAEIAKILNIDRSYVTKLKKYVTN